MSKSTSEDVFYTLTYTEGTARYFVEIEGSYYEVTLEKEQFKVNREATDIEKVGGKPNIVVTSDKENIVTASISKEADIDKIIITSKEELGEAVITVKEENSNEKAICTVKVMIPVTNIELNKEEAKVNKGTTLQLNANITPSGATEKLIWTSENEEIATVTDEGLVTGILEGTTRITVTNETKTISKTCVVTVIIPATGISLNKSATAITKGQEETLTVTITPANTTEAVVWSSDKPSVATVENGVIRAINTGTATITVTCGEKTAYCTVTVVIPVTGLSISQETASIEQGETITITATPTPQNTTDKVTWTGLSSSIIGIAENTTASVPTVTITGIAIGNATVTATCGSHSKTCNVTVTSPVAKVGTISETTHTAQDLSNKYTWDEMAILAEAIAKNSSIKWDKTEEVNLTFHGNPYKIGIGDKMKVDGKVVRILGFNHDEMSTEQKKTAYDGTCTTAGISFEYVDFITDNKAMNNTATNSGGWGSCALRGTLNGTVYNSLPSMKNYIKEVKKAYCANRSSATLSYCNDKLWLLSCAEIWNDGKESTGKGCSMGVEGNQYKYYKKVTAGVAYNANNNALKKPSNVSGTTSLSSISWWMRSPYYGHDGGFCYVYWMRLWHWLYC